jgi:hypothetical protein
VVENRNKEDDDSGEDMDLLVFDLSANNLNMLRKGLLCCFKHIKYPFYEIYGANDNILYTSELHLKQSGDPIWHPTKKLRKKDLEPNFTVKVHVADDKT